MPRMNVGRIMASYNKELLVSRKENRNMNGQILSLDARITKVEKNLLILETQFHEREKKLPVANVATTISKTLEQDKELARIGTERRYTRFIFTSIVLTYLSFLGYSKFIL